MGNFFPGTYARAYVYVARHRRSVNRGFFTGCPKPVGCLATRERRPWTSDQRNYTCVSFGRRESSLRENLFGHLFYNDRFGRLFKTRFFKTRSKRPWNKASLFIPAI